MITSDERDELRGWIAGRLPQSLYTELLDVIVDREEITIVGRIPEPELGSGSSAVEREAGLEGRLGEFRERTREERMTVAREAERRYRRKVSWGAQCGDRRAMFTTVSAPVMTRMRQSERQVLDTLIAAGVARSRSDALAWCVRLVERNTDTWLTELRTSLEHVQRVRAQGPDQETGAETGTDTGTSGSEDPSEVQG